jgi:hypothetical protein
MAGVPGQSRIYDFRELPLELCRRGEGNGPIVTPDWALATRTKGNQKHSEYRGSGTLTALLDGTRVMLFPPFAVGNLI